MINEKTRCLGRNCNDLDSCNRHLVIRLQQPTDDNVVPNYCAVSAVESWQSLDESDARRDALES